MCRVIELASRRRAPTSVQYYEHPAGVCLPFEYKSIGALVPPDVRAAIACGSFKSDLVACLSDVLRKGDRVLVIGAAFGLLTTLIAKHRNVDHVIALEADAPTAAHMTSVHALNGVDWIETVRAAPAAAMSESAVASTDHARSNAYDGRYARVPAVDIEPSVDLSLVIADAQISVIVWDDAEYGLDLIGAVDLGPVQRILVHGTGDAGSDDDGADTISEQGFTIRTQASVLCFERLEDY